MIYKYIQTLIEYGIKEDLISKEDDYVIRNQFIDLFKLDNWEECNGLNISLDEILEYLLNYSCDNNLIENTIANRDLLDTKIMGILTMLPHEIESKFKEKSKKNIIDATNWYYDYNKKINYIRTTRIKKNIEWEYKSNYGTLNLTINLSKPEKDPKDIIAAKNCNSNTYPKCKICVENMGFSGSISHPARQNLRPIKVELNNNNWYLQYSPYSYYNEHCIVFNSKHVPMIINKNTFENLFEFVDKFPHYFIGSNADLSIVGGSILSHEHYQGGNNVFPIQKARVIKKFVMKKYPSVTIGIVKWPMSTLRLNSKNKNELINACNDILNKWKNYSNEELRIIAYSDNQEHNTITPIVRKKRNIFECDLVLRNNITSERHPYGEFHPHEELHHIKKENIGLIEVMGLAILPGRLKKELEEVEHAIIENKNLYENELTKKHAEWASEIKKKYPTLNQNNIKDIIGKEIGIVFEKVLIDCGVFKKNKIGNQEFNKFLNYYI